VRFVERVHLESPGVLVFPEARHSIGNPLTGTDRGEHPRAGLCGEEHESRRGVVEQVCVVDCEDGAVELALAGERAQSP
jgi:hypothetical protein